MMEVKSFRSIMNFSTLALMNTIDFATDNDASYEEYTIIQSGTSDLESIKDILYNEYIHQTQ